MIIACPECTSPFQVVDGQIAALVQVECPTCSFRMILDFEAANDASLREAGMQMAQGFRDEATYREAVGGGQVVYDTSQAEARPKPDLRPVPEPEPEPEPARQPVARPQPTPTPQPQPRPVAQPTPTPVVQPTPTPVVQPTPTPVARPQPTPQPRPEPVARPQPTPPPEPTPRPPIRQQPAAQSKPPVRNRPRAKPTLIAQTAPPPVQVEPQRGRRGRRSRPVPALQPEAAGIPPGDEANIETHIGKPPERPAQHQPPVRQPPIRQPQPADNLDAFDSEDIEIELEPEVAPEPRRPAHARQGEVIERDAHDVPKVDTTPPPLDLDDELDDEAEPTDEAKPAAKSGVLRNVIGVFVLLILLLITGLAVWSLLDYQNPDPRQLIQDKFGVDLGPLAPPVDDAKADEKAGSDAAAGNEDDGE